MKTEEIEIEIAQYFGIRQNIIVPGVHWGLNLHECDLLILTKSNYATEIEIKISLSDLKKDIFKRHGHKSNLIKYLYFAIPEKLEKYIEHIPKAAGILIVKPKPKNGEWYRRVKKIRHAEKNKNCRPLTLEERHQLLRLGNIRTWGLRKKILKLKNGSHKN